MPRGGASTDGLSTDRAPALSPLPCVPKPQPSLVLLMQAAALPAVQPVGAF